MQNTKKIGTHSGRFHCDEVLGCVFLTNYVPQFQNSQIVRTRDDIVLKDLDIVIDVGSVFDPATYRFDHHQNTFQDNYSDKHSTRLSSAGLVYKYFSQEILENAIKSISNQYNLPQVYLDKEQKESIILKVYNDYVESLDANDNGIDQYDQTCKKKFSSTSDLPQQVSRFNPISCESVHPDIRFKEAMLWVQKDFESFLKPIIYEWLPAKNIVKSAINKRFDVHSSGAIIHLEKHCPWGSHLYEIEESLQIQNQIKFILFDGGDSFRVQAVGEQGQKFKNRKDLKDDWKGFRNDELAKISGIQDIVFVHMTGFIGAAHSYKSALKMAELSL